MPRRIVVPPALLDVAARQQSLVSRRQCREHGMTDQQVDALVSAARWRRVLPAVLDPRVPADGRFDALDRSRRRGAIVGALALPGSVVTGVPALVLHGAQGAPRRVLPEVTFPNGAPRRNGKPVRVRRERLQRWTFVDGVPCVTAELALAQAVPGLDRSHAIALMDSARRRRLVTEDGFRRARELARGRRGAARTTAWWDLSDPRADSPVESQARVDFVDAGYPPDAVQLEIFDEQGRFLARPDLVWFLPGGRVVPVELDGHEAHSTPEALFHDRRRQNALVARGARMLRYTGRDVTRGVVVPDVRRLLDVEGWAPRPWTGDGPLILPRRAPT
ncbi:hypothetical protein [Isoptericola sp. NPDC057391]|uniref:hypothetical protein n=1 Tax=Isoptericola sp. NPDC057391 TaxID=3346117 RepID=UPI00362D05F9